MTRTDLDNLTRELVVNADSFDALLNAEGGYRPTLREDLDPRNTILANAYDLAQAVRGDARRAFRG